MSLRLTIVPTYNGSSTKAKEWIREVRKRRRTAVPLSTFREGNIVYTRYVARQAYEWDFNPVILVLRTSKRHVFGININWLNRTEKKKLINFLISKKFHEMDNRLRRIPIFRAIRRLKFSHKAYRLYHYRELADPKVWELSNHDLYEALSLRLVTKHYKKRS